VVQADSWISLVSAAVALPAAAVAVWQAREARRQAKAAEDQVVQARRSAGAAEAQVGIMHRQEEADQAERDERDAPMFTCTPKGCAGSICKIEIRMDSGPQEVTIRITEIRVRPEGHDPTDTGSQLPDDSHQYRVVPSAAFSVDVDLRAGRDSVRVELRLECTELSERGRSWTRRKSVPVAAPPALPQLA
jgi:hypothetical protein